MTREKLLKIAKPILFNTDMVRAILDGRKTVTRRVIKEPKDFMFDGETSFMPAGKYGKKYLHMDCVNVYDSAVRYIRCPYSEKDILYVRETWNKCGKGYRYYVNWKKDDIADITKWRPSIHMPKEAARIFLKVTDVRVEHLQNMNLDDFLAEGVCLLPEAFNDPENAYMQAKHIFSNDIWDKTVNKSDRDRYGWDANPWVWVIEFEPCEISE